MPLIDTALWNTSTMTTTPAPPLLPHLWKSVLLSGVLSLVLGVLVLVWPGISILVAAIFFGAYLLVTGISQVFHAFTLHVSAGGRVILFISGAAALILAVLCFRSIQNSILLLAIWIGIGFIFRGVATAVSAISDPDTPGRGWEIFVGVISLIAGLVLLGYPLGSLFALTKVTGAFLVVIGIFELIASFGIRKASKDLHERVEAPPAAPAV
jgi:uncharacterized membrane protein HdeD (DUF308 family)